MRTRAAALTVALGLGAVALSPALPAAAKNSPLNVKALTNSINHAKSLTYLAQYTSFTNGQKTTVTIAQSPPKSNFTTSSGSVINNGKTTYYCSTSSSTSGNSGNTGSASNSGNSGNSGSATTTTTTSQSGTNCLSVKGANPLLGLETAFGPATTLSALAEAKQGLVSRLLGIKVLSTTATFAGQSSTCVTVTVRGRGGKYCVTKQGILSYSGSSSSSGSSSYFELTKYSSSPPASLFSLPAGATTATVPGGGSVP
jgi:trimeric autotransporter adhesin